MLIALFDEMEFIKTYDKYRKQLEEDKKHDKDTIASYKKVAVEIEVKLKVRESKLLEKVNDIEIKDIFEGEPLAGEKIGVMKDLKCIAQLLKIIYYVFHFSFCWDFCLDFSIYTFFGGLFHTNWMFFKTAKQKLICGI